MPKSTHYGRGSKGLTGRDQLKKDLDKLSDSAKRKKLEQTTAENLKRVQGGKKPRSVENREFQRISRAARMKDPAYLERKIADMETKAKEADKSKNVKAAATYRKVTAAYRARLKTARSAKKKGG